MKVDFPVDNALAWLSPGYHSLLIFIVICTNHWDNEVHELGGKGFPSFLGSSLSKLHSCLLPAKNSAVMPRPPKTKTKNHSLNKKEHRTWQSEDLESSALPVIGCMNLDNLIYFSKCWCPSSEHESFKRVPSPQHVFKKCCYIFLSWKLLRRIKIHSPSMSSLLNYKTKV